MGLIGSVAPIGLMGLIGSVAPIGLTAPKELIRLTGPPAFAAIRRHRQPSTGGAG
jgi:hypothetical protein